MGFLDPFTDGVSVVSGGISRPSHHRRHSSRSHHKKHRSRSRSSSRHKTRSIAGSIFGLESNYEKHNSSRGSFFGLGNNNSRSSFFGFGRPSYYKRSPRQGFMHRAYKQLKRILRNLVHYAKRHPWKVFFLAIMPLITGGALTALLARFGLRMPPSLERMVGLASKAASGDHFSLVGDAVRMAGEFGGSSSVSVDRGHDGGLQWERRTSRAGHAGNDSWGNSIMGVAKMFI